MKRVTTLVLSLILAMSLIVPAAASATAANKPVPKMISGTIEKEADGSILVKGYGKDESVILKITDDTYVIDSVKGTPMMLKDRIDDSIIAYYGPEETKSLPAQSNAVAILCNLPQDYSPPYFAKVEALEKGTNEVKVTINEGSLIATIKGDVPISPFKTKNIVTIGNINVGSDLLLWYDVATLSYPGSAMITKAVILGTPVPDKAPDKTPDKAPNKVTFELTTNQTYVNKYTTMIPLRKVADAFGYTISWDGPTKTVTLAKGDEKHTLTLNKNEYGLVVKNGSTFVALSYFEKGLGGSYLSYESKIIFTK